MLHTKDFNGTVLQRKIWGRGGGGGETGHSD